MWKIINTYVLLFLMHGVIGLYAMESHQDPCPILSRYAVMYLNTIPCYMQQVVLEVGLVDIKTKKSIAQCLQEIERNIQSIKQKIGNDQLKDNMALNSTRFSTPQLLHLLWHEITCTVDEFGNRANNIKAFNSQIAIEDEVGNIKDNLNKSKEATEKFLEKYFGAEVKEIFNSAVTSSEIKSAYALYIDDLPTIKTNGEIGLHNYILSEDYMSGEEILDNTDSCSNKWEDFVTIETKDNFESSLICELKKVVKEKGLWVD